MNEVWKDIEGYEGIYQVSSFGRVRRVKDGSLMNGNTRKDGYKQVTLCKEGEGRAYGVHRLVALAFVEGYADGLVVNHKDEDKQNNHADNLEWCTRSYNQTYNDCQLKGRWSASERTEFKDVRLSFGRRLKQLRQSAGLTSSDAARRIGLSGNTLLEIEAGRTVSLDTMLALCGMYGYTLEIIRKV